MGGLNFSAPREHSRQPDRRQRDGHREPPAEQLCFQGECCDVLEHPLPQRDVGEIVDVSPQRVLRIGSAVDVVEQERRQPSPRRFAIIRR